MLSVEAVALCLTRLAPLAAEPVAVYFIFSSKAPALTISADKELITSGIKADHCGYLWTTTDVVYLGILFL